MLVAFEGAVASLPGEAGILQEGVYAHTDPYNKEIIELKNGRFRYWSSSDMKTNFDPSYPLTGRYEFSDGILLLKHAKIWKPRWRFRIFKGVPTLWSKTALEFWRSHPKEQQFRTLFKQRYRSEEIWRSDSHRRLQWED